MRFLTITLFACAISQSALAAPLPPPEKTDRCAVCGMFVAPFPAWVAGFELKDGRRYYFDGPKDLFTCLLDLPGCLPGVTEDQVVDVAVTEYYSTRQLPAAEVIFVTGSDVLGPMGKELVPILGREAAETFRRDHAGEKLLRFDGRQLVELATQP